MTQLFQDILEIETVQGAFFISFNGEVIFSQVKTSQAEVPVEKDWQAVLERMGDIREAEIVFEYNIVYILESKSGHLVVLMERSAPLAMVRLNCSIVLHVLEQEIHKPRGLGRFFHGGK